MIFPDDENGDVLRRMQAGGDNLGQPRDIDYSVVFLDEQSAAKFARMFREKGHKVSFEEAGTVPELPWDVVVTRFMVPTHSEIGAFEQELEDAATPLGGRNDGWGCFEQPEPSLH